MAEPVKGASIKEHMREMVAKHGGDMHLVRATEDGMEAHHMTQEGKYSGPTPLKNMAAAKAHMADCMEGE